MRRSISTLAAALLALAPALALAQGTGSVLVPDPQNPTTRVGTRGANFLEVGVGARGLALAGAYTSIAEGATALYWNPAGIAEAEGPIAAVSIANLYGSSGVKHTFVGGVMPAGGSGAFGIALTQLTSGDIQRTTENFPDGGDPTFGQTFSYTATSAGLYYARRLTDRLAVGVGAKFVTEGIDNAHANYFGLDIGTKFRTGLYGTHIAATMSNIGSSGRYRGAAIQRFIQNDFRPGATPIEFSTADIQLPTLFRFSVRTDLLGASDALLAANPHHTLYAVLEANDAIDTDVQMILAAQYSYRDLVFLRAGKRFVNEKQADFRSFGFGASFGGGVRVPMGGGRKVSFDYAYTGMNDLKNVQVFSLEIGF
jgi:hypothetical protein